LYFVQLEVFMGSMHTIDKRKLSVSFLCIFSAASLRGHASSGCEGLRAADEP
jgi:hypothetical protein